MFTLPAAALVGALALVAPVAAPAHTSPELNSKSYALTQVIENHTAQNLQLTSLTVDNGATIQSHPDTVAPGGELRIVATNHGNGIQMWVTLTADDGSQITSDSNIPKVNSNKMTGDISNSTPSAHGFTAGWVDSGDKAEFGYTVSDTPNGCKSSDSCYESFLLRSNEHFWN